MHPGWLQAHYVGKHDLECLILPSFTLRVLGYVPPHQVFAVLGTKPKAVFILSKHYTLSFILIRQYTL